MIVIHPIFDLTSNKSSKTTCAFQDGNVLNELIDENTKTLSFCMIQEFLSKKYFKLYICCRTKCLDNSLGEPQVKVIHFVIVQIADGLAL